MNFSDRFLMVFADQSSMTYAFSNSDWMGQAICVILFLFSIVTWIIMLEKHTSLKMAERANREFLNLFREKHNPLAMNTTNIPAICPIAEVYLTACKRIESFHLSEGGGRRALNDSELRLVESSLNQAIEDQLLVLQKRMLFLSTAVSASPFLGLFGTVWGITIAFTNLAMQGKADIQTLAPGVSGALLTTVIALVVAIPSLVGYNIIHSKLNAMTVKLDDFADEFNARLKIEQLDALEKSL